MTYSLGTAEGEIRTTYDGRGVDQAEKDVEGLTKSSGKSSKALAGVGTAATVAGVAVAAGIGLAVKSAADFEQRMSAVQAVSGATAGEMDKLSKKALQLGKDTAFSATDAAQAMEELVKSGLSVEEVLNGAADATVALAAAGEVSLPEAAKIASNAMNQFNLAAKDMPHVADLIAGAANASAIDVSEFGQSLAQAGAVANLVGASFDDTAAAIALMGNAGIKGSDAGTSLKTMLSNLQPQTKKQKELMQELGITTADGANKFFDANGKLKSFSEIAGVLQDSLKGMTAAQKQATLETIFGSDAIRAAAIFANEGSAGFDKMSASMNKVKAADVAKTRLDNLKGSIEQMKGSLETAGIAIGTIVLPALRRIVDAVTEVVNAFLNLSPATQSLVVSIAGTVGAALLAIGVYLKLIRTLMAVRDAYIALRLAAVTSQLAMAGLVGVVIIAIAALVIAIILLWKKSETFRNIVIGVWEAIKGAVMAAVNWITGTAVPALQAAWSAIMSALSAVGAFFASIWNGMVAVVRTVLGAIIGVITTIFNVIVTIVTTYVNIILAPWRLLWSIFGGVITATFKLIVAIIKLALVLVAAIIWQGILQIITVSRIGWNILMAIIRVVWTVIKAIVSAGIAVVVGYVKTGLAIIKAIFSTTWAIISAIVRTAISIVRSMISTGVNAAKTAVSAAWNAVKSITTSIFNGLPSPIRNAISTVLGILRNLPGQIKGIFAGAASWLFSAGKAIIQGLLDGIESMIGAVTSKIDAVTSKISKFLPGSPVEEGPLKVLNRGYAGEQIMLMLAGGIEKGIPAIVDALQMLSTARPATAASVIPATGLTPAVAAAIPAAPASTGNMRIVSGTLSIDERGRAFLTGLAQDVIDDNADYNATIARMG